MNRPFLAGERLYLRPLEESDLGEEYLQWLNDAEVRRFLGTGTAKFPTTLSSLEKYLERFQGTPTDLILAIIDKKSNLHIGNVTLNRIDWVNRAADTGILIGRKDFWGKGYAFEAWALLIEHAFKNLGLRKVNAGAIAGHDSSLGVLKKLGFQEEGVLRKEYLLDGEFRDAIRMGLFREEFDKCRRRSSVQQLPRRRGLLV